MFGHISATVTPYCKVVLDEMSYAILDFQAPVTSVYGEALDGAVYLPKLDLVTDLTFHVKEGVSWPDKTKLPVTIRLTRCSEDPAGRVFTDLCSFTVDLAKAKESGRAKQTGLDYLTHTQVTRLRPGSVRLPAGAEYGTYVLKVLVDTQDETESTVQGIAPLEVLPGAPDRSLVDAYIDRLKNMPKEDARKLSIQALQRTGILDENPHRLKAGGRMASPSRRSSPASAGN